jgi:peptidoglycan hydrolase-like protein with peptidoglycan-binding domain
MFIQSRIARRNSLLRQTLDTIFVYVQNAFRNPKASFPAPVLVFFRHIYGSAYGARKTNNKRGHPHMKFLISAVFLSLTFCISAFAQTAATTPAADASAPVAEKKAKKPIFRANKEQIKEVQTMLKTKGLYTGEPVGKFDPDTRTAIKAWQKDNGLKQTGTLNRATLEKMGIALTDKQKAIPVDENSYASADEPSTDKPKAVGLTASMDGAEKPKRTIFRATKDQITEAQKLLKSRSMYSGEETGKLDDPTREGLKKFQEANNLKVTGTLNQVTLEKMGIALTDKQKETAGQK